MGLLRAETILKIKKGIKEGIGATRLYWDLRAEGPVTRKTVFLADYREEAGIAKKDGLLRFVRRDRYPTTAVIASIKKEVSWEVMYKVKVESILKPGEPVTERFVNITSNVPMTPDMIEAQIEKQWAELEKYAAEEIKALQVWSAYKRVSD